MIKIIGKKEEAKQKQGFTLAEILITLAVIGIVASLVIPAMMNSVNDAELRTAFKKIYTILSQSFMRIKTDNGGTLNSVFNDDNVVISMLSSHMSFTKSCTQSAQVIGNCWSTNVKTMTGESTGMAPNMAYVLNDGSFGGVISTIETCTSENSFCVNMLVDVNGFKNPNIVGKDIYLLYVTKDGLIPAGTPNFAWTTSCGSGERGWGCASRVLTGKDY